jgi:TfoX/Sxy family transcriptional regulator of competence genes
MPYDEQLAVRIRALLEHEEGVTEKPMFGGLAFLVHGNMAVSASGRGGIMVRVEPRETEVFLESTPATPMIMAGRQVNGWVRVAADEVKHERELALWVERGATYARSLPAK